MPLPAMFRWAAVPLCGVVVFAGGGPRALANGDPASHVLPSREVFVPFDPSLCSPAGRRLDALTEATKSAGYPIKVAVIPTAEDLGTLFRLFGRPEAYARQLASELPPQLFRRGRGGRYRLLVLMPDRIGLFNSSKRELRALRRLSADGESREALVRSAIEIVSKLSRTAGHRVRDPRPKPPCPDTDLGSPSGGSGSGWAGPVLIAVAPVAMLALAIFFGARGRRRDAAG
jgi:hypothetical protein